jgi:hypothetical protein
MELAKRGKIKRTYNTVDWLVVTLSRGERTGLRAFKRIVGVYTKYDRSGSSGAKNCDTTPVK